MERLNVLAVQLMNCRKRGNRLTLECVVESARILAEAKALAGAGFGTWLADQARMDRATAYRHLGVGKFVREHVALTRQIATLSLAKIYAISTLDSATAVRILTGQLKFSVSLEEISDVQFRREFRELFPPRQKRRTRQHVYQSAASALSRAAKAVQEASRVVRAMTPLQRRKIELKIHALGKLISGWKGVA
jgi:hypothetical protein